MNTVWDLEIFNEEFNGMMRRMDESIAQLELWCDTSTINHKKEEAKLDDYAVLSKNLYALKEELEEALALYDENEDNPKWVTMQYANIAEKMERYRPTEKQINDWAREVNGLNILLVNSNLLREHREYLEKLLEV